MDEWVYSHGIPPLGESYAYDVDDDEEYDEEAAWEIYERRNRALRRWWRVRRLARTVGKAAVCFKEIYEEVVEWTYRPGNKGAKRARAEFSAALLALHG